MRLKGGRNQSIIKRGTDDLEAYHLYLKGRYSLHAVALPKALTSFEAAIARDPHYAQAHAGLADVYCSLGFYGFIPSSVGLQKARASADHAIALDDSLAEAHESRAKAELYFGWDFRVLERELRRAISLNPKNPISHVWLGLGLALQGRFEEVKAEVALAFELEPIGPGGSVLALIHICTGQIALAIETCQRILEFNPTSVQGLWASGLGYMAQGDHQQAITVFETAVSLTGRSSVMLGGLGAALAQGGRREEAREILGELEKKATHSHVPPAARAMIHMYLGEIDEVFACLGTAFEEHDTWAACIAVWPGWEQIRSDPRYAALLQKHGLESLMGDIDAT